MTKLRNWLSAEKEKSLEVIIISHNDLDGYAVSEIVKQSEHKKMNPEFQFASPMSFDKGLVINSSYHEVDVYVEEVAELLYRIDTTPIVYITDITPGTEAYGKLYQAAVDGRCNIVYIDHHLLSFDLAKQFEEASNVLYILEEGTSATMLAYNHIVRKHVTFSTLSTLVDLWDTFKWKDLKQGDYNYNLAIPARNLNRLFFDILGPEGLMDELRANKMDAFYLTNIKYLSVLNAREKQIQRYMEMKNDDIRKSFVSYKGDEFIVGMVFAESHISELGNYLCEQNEEIDMALIVNTNSMPFKLSARTTSDDFNVSEFMKDVFDGGGHVKAAGAELDLQKCMSIFRKII